MTPISASALNPSKSVDLELVDTNLANASPRIHGVLERVRKKVAPVWPLKDYVAVNPYLGFSDRKFLAARSELRSVSDIESLMDAGYYRQQYAAGTFLKADINTAIDELVADDVQGAERLSVNDVVSFLQQQPDQDLQAGHAQSRLNGGRRVIRTISETIDEYGTADWSRVVGEEISKHCAAHYDDGQASWSSPWRELPLYLAWRSSAQHDRAFELLGVSGFRKLVQQLPLDPAAAVSSLLERLKVPVDLWDEFLLCQALAMPGWSGWTNYQTQQAEARGEQCQDFAGLLAMRLAYEYALSVRLGVAVDWNSVARVQARVTDSTRQATDEALLVFAALRSCEVAYRRKLLGDLACQLQESADESAETLRESGQQLRKLAQMVFCIDVRSERFRRHIESACDEIETFGFAGFFGLPIEYVPLGETCGTSQVPALISPHFKVFEEVHSEQPDANHAAIERRAAIRWLRKSWKEFQTSATSCFAFVETTGFCYGVKLLGRMLGIGGGSNARFDGVAARDRSQLGPTLRGLNQQGVKTSAQADLAEAMLRNLGLSEDFARLVVICGHGSQTDNNPLQAGLDCGACGGHSGEANARFAAQLLNQKYIRQALAERGIEIPDDVHFLAAVHNTTTDVLSFHDVQDVPESHAGDLRALETHASLATQQTRNERMPLLAAEDSDDVLRRSRDWSEVRPEWGLAGNAAFIAAPRTLTSSISLAGRSFLHSYDHRRDPGYSILEQIMTAPMVVAHWINMQYYASTVDPEHFGSGSKAVHNVVGRFGIFSGNGSELMTGLPWQSVHDGCDYQHDPLRLLVVLAAPRTAIESIVAKHELIANLLTNGWLQLIAIEDETCYRFTETRTWEELSAGLVTRDTLIADSCV